MCVATLTRQAESYVYIVFYRLSEDSEFNHLAAFDSKADAEEYRLCQVWQHLNTFVSRQPVY